MGGKRVDLTNHLVIIYMIWPTQYESRKFFVANDNSTRR